MQYYLFWWSPCLSARKPVCPHPFIRTQKIKSPRKNARIPRKDPLGERLLSIHFVQARPSTAGSKSSRSRSLKEKFRQEISVFLVHLNGGQCTTKTRLNGCAKVNLSDRSGSRKFFCVPSFAVVLSLPVATLSPVKLEVQTPIVSQIKIP